jgi:hypothetical protein
LRSERTFSGGRTPGAAPAAASPTADRRELGIVPGRLPKERAIPTDAAILPALPTGLAVPVEPATRLKRRVPRPGIGLRTPGRFPLAARTGGSWFGPKHDALSRINLDLGENGDCRDL